MINSTAYYNDFWNEMRGKQAVTDSLYNNRESKTNAYHLPGESNKKYTAVLQKESAVRQLATVVNATRSDSRLSLIVKVVVSKNIYFLFVHVIRYCSVPDHHHFE